MVGIVDRTFCQRLGPSRQDAGKQMVVQVDLDRPLLVARLEQPDQETIVFGLRLELRIAGK